MRDEIIRAVECGIAAWFTFLSAWDVVRFARQPSAFYVFAGVTLLILTVAMWRDAFKEKDGG